MSMNCELALVIDFEAMGHEDDFDELIDCVLSKYDANIDDVCIITKDGFYVNRLIEKSPKYSNATVLPVVCPNVGLDPDKTRVEWDRKVYGIGRAFKKRCFFLIIDTYCGYASPHIEQIVRAVDYGYDIALIDELSTGIDVKIIRPWTA